MFIEIQKKELSLL